MFSSVIGFELFPVVRKYLGRTSVLSYGAISKMPNQKWFCLRISGGYLLPGTGQAYDQKELPGAGPCSGETTAGLWHRSISRSAHHTPGVPLSCFPSSSVAFTPPSASLLSVPSDPLPLLLGDAAQGTCPGGQMLTQNWRMKTRQRGTEQKVSWAEDLQKHLRNLLLSGNCFSISLCNSQHSSGFLLKKSK